MRHISTRYEKSRRSPHGERGLKFDGFGELFQHSGRSPHGERGLKFHGLERPSKHLGRSPHGERGLKCVKTITKRRKHVALLMESVD